MRKLKLLKRKERCLNVTCWEGVQGIGRFTVGLGCRSTALHTRVGTEENQQTSVIKEKFGRSLVSENIKKRRWLNTLKGF